MKKSSQIRKLTRTGNGRSMFVIIPSDAIDSLHWREHQKLSVKRVTGGVMIRDARSKKKG